MVAGDDPRRGARRRRRGPCCRREADATIYYAGAASIDLFSSDTANYRDNLADGEPRIWIALRRQDGGAELELTKVTADPTEGEAMFESGCDVIGTVPMPPEIASWIAAFVDQFHVERVFHKRKRDRAGGDARRMPGELPMKERAAHERTGQGDEDKGFLARWSQRKQEAKQPEPKPDEPAAETEARRRRRRRPRPRRSSISPACQSLRR